eukprot:COSAG02_NODE_9363_length_2242_cov_1.962203_4_plen_36_part_01
MINIPVPFVTASYWRNNIGNDDGYGIVGDAEDDIAQ